MDWRKWLKPVVMLLYTILICVSLPFVVKEFQKKNPNSPQEAWFIGGIFVMGAVPISLWTILEHVVHYTKPYLQRHIIRVLWMVPIYGLNAWFALKFQAEAIYLDTLRECYEAYVIYNFMIFLLNYLKHEYPDLGYMIEQKDPLRHMCPFCCCPPWKMGTGFITRCKNGVLQYTLIRPITTLIAFICEMCGVYHENQFRIDGAFTYLTVINNISQVWAMYSLIMFYRGMKIELTPLKPVSKFICVKFVVFLSFWQSVVFAILTWSGVISKVDAWKLYKPQEISSIFQNFFVCIEMFIAAIAHHFSFSVTPYRNNPDFDQNARCCYSCLAMCDVSDVKRDVVDHVKHVGKTVKSKLPLPQNGPGGGASSSNSGVRHSESTPLINHYEQENDCVGEMQSPPINPAMYKTRLDSLGSIGSAGSLLTRMSSHDIGRGGSRPNVVLGTTTTATTGRPPVPQNYSMNNQLILSQDEDDDGVPEEQSMSHYASSVEGDPIKFTAHSDVV